MANDLDMALVELEQLKRRMKFLRANAKRIETILGFLQYDLERTADRLRRGRTDAQNG